MIALDPNLTVAVTLAADAGPDAPAFVYRYRTKKQAAEAVRLHNAAIEEADPARSEDLLLRALSVSLAGFRNVTDPDTGRPLKFERVVADEAGEAVVRVPAVFAALSEFETWRMSNRVIQEMRLSEKNYFSSASSPASGAGPSAGTAAADSAPTPPAPPTP